jgi:hypothetical protein
MYIIIAPVMPIQRYIQRPLGLQFTQLACRQLRLYLQLRDQAPTKSSLGQTDKAFG